LKKVNGEVDDEYETTSHVSDEDWYSEDDE
jgi:hypothetical protein